MSLWQGRSVLRFRVGPPVALCLFWLAVAGPVSGQVIQSTPSVPQLGTQPAPAAAVIDTAVAVFEIPPEFPQAVRVHTVQDTVGFGDLFHLVLDFMSPAEGDLEINPADGADWLAPVPPPQLNLVNRLLGKQAAALPDLSDLPDLDQQVRSVRSFRVYRTNPFRLQVGSYLSPVIHVLGRVETPDQTAGIRSPRSVGWSLLVILILLAILALILLIARWLWHRNSRRLELTDRPLPAPAWLAAAIELRDLLQSGFLATGDNRAFLDGLAGIIRRFVAGRYRIAAQDMTGREIMAAVKDLGHRSAQPGVLARLIAGLDRHRYDPEGCEVAWSREQAVLFFDQMAEVRIMPRFTEIPGQLRREGDLAWAGLERELSSGPSRLKNARQVIPGSKT